MENIFKFFNKAGSRAIGISIGSSSIKLAELRKKGKQIILTHFGIANLPPDAIMNNEIINDFAVSSTLSQLIKQMPPFRDQKIAISVSGSSVIIKRIMIEGDSKKEIQETIFWEAEQYFPFDFSEVALDYHILSETTNKQADVLVVGTAKKMIENYMECVQKAGIKVSIVDLDYFAFAHAFQKNNPSQEIESIGLIDCGASSTKLTILQGNIPCFAKESSIGGTQLTEKIAQALNISFADAENLKISTNSIPEPVSQLIQQEANLISEEISNLLKMYQTTQLGPNPQSIFLSGGASQLASLTATLENTLSIPVRIFNPFNIIAYDYQVFQSDTIQSLAPFATISIGLALRALEND